MLWKKGETKFEQATAGKQPAVLAAIEDLGPQDTKWGERTQCKITYVLAELGSTGRQKRVSQTVTQSLHEKSKLTALLTSILGSVPDELDPNTLIGIQVILTLGTVVKDGQEKTRLYAVEPAPEGQNVQFTKSNAMRRSS